MTEKIGIFGGTFDPPHLGHLILAAEARYQLDLDHLLWVLTPDPPHKQNQDISPLEDRLDLVLAAIRDNPAFELSRIDIDRSPPHYALDTIRLLQKQYPQANLIYLMGGDSLRDLPTWYQVRDFVAACHALGVMRRPGIQMDLKKAESQIPGITQKVWLIDAPLIEIAASDIRRRIRDGNPTRYFLPEPVWEIIQSRGLYQESKFDR